MKKNFIRLLVLKLTKSEEGEVMGKMKRKTITEHKVADYISIEQEVKLCGLCNGNGITVPDEPTKPLKNKVSNVILCSRCLGKRTVLFRKRIHTIITESPIIESEQSNTSK